ncbi:hypothetical protein FDP22_24150 (plasmid) [Paroceanicella profunda]|uniref:Endoglucanase n=1 Tax=Paroceanicella profunda TaxID=2579971 RepID=A0A5B8G2X8_9RHOB|nr:glycoside hydrolase family 9 protein [Paroceanicella profunda]QDL94955.1 hypothetical protein FDP22_24150 [Paroceanicella profunda]
MADTVISGGAPGVVTFADVDTWDTGMAVQATFEAHRRLDHWTLVLELHAGITSIWGARIVSRSGPLYTLADEGWNGALASGETARFGFQADAARQDLAVTRVNGVPVSPPEPVPDPLPVVSLHPVTATEGDGTARMRVTLSHASDMDVTVKWAFDGGSAGAADRAAPGARSLTIAAGQTATSFPVRILDDALEEGTETARITLTSATGARIGTASALLTLIDDDLPGLRLARATAAEEDGTAHMRVVLSEARAEDVTVRWAVVPGGSADAADYRAGQSHGTVTLPAGTTRALLDIPLRDDRVAEPTESLHVRLLSAQGAALVSPDARLTITDGDGAAALPEVSVSVSTHWTHGFAGELTVTNDTGRPLESWRLTFEDADFVIDRVWGAVARTEADGDPSLIGRDWTTGLAQGQSVTIGFVATGSAPDAPYFDIYTEAGSGPGPNPRPGTGHVPGTPSPFAAADYGEALGLSMQFYYAQYSGDLPEDFPVDWRGDSALSDGADVGRDLTGGWYDAGDHVKFGLPMASSATLLAWGASDYAEGYKASGTYDDILTHLAWVTDYFLRAYDDKGTETLADDVFYAQVGNGAADHAYWGAPEDMTMARPAYAVTARTPGTEVTAETAAALAASSIVFREAGRTAYADELLDTAKQLFAFSEAYQGSYTAAVPDAADFYNSWSGYQDELAWSAAWLNRATGEAAYLDKAQAWYTASGTTWGLSWDNKSMGTAALLAAAPGGSSAYADLGAHIDYWMNSLPRTPGTDTNGGLAWLDAWGSNRYAANTAFLAMEYADLTEARGGSQARIDAVVDFAADQLDYMLGDNPDGQSYVVGFGDDYPLNPHHRGASGTDSDSDPAANAHTLYGALVGGPDVNGAYADLRTDYVANEVATDYNAGFSSALAALIAEHDLN